MLDHVGIGKPALHKKTLTREIVASLQGLESAEHSVQFRVQSSHPPHTDKDIP